MLGRSEFRAGGREGGRDMATTIKGSAGHQQVVASLLACVVFLSLLKHGSVRREGVKTTEMRGENEGRKAGGLWPGLGTKGRFSFSLRCAVCWCFGVRNGRNDRTGGWMHACMHQ